MNKIIIRDANLSFSIDDFSEQFFECMMSFLMNLFSEYDQFPLIETSRDFTAFQTSVKLIRMTTFSQKTINSIAQFMRIIIRILMNHIPRIILFFMNDIDVKRLFDTSANREKILFEIRKKTFEHIR